MIAPILVNKAKSKHIRANIANAGQYNIIKATSQYIAKNEIKFKLC